MFQGVNILHNWADSQSSGHRDQSNQKLILDCNLVTLIYGLKVFVDITNCHLAWSHWTASMMQTISRLNLFIGKPFFR